MSNQLTSNSAVSIDFNNEVAEHLNATIKANGKELRWAVAMSNDPHNFPVTGLLGAEKGKRSKVIRELLIKQSTAFAAQEAKIDDLTKKANDKHSSNLQKDSAKTARAPLSDSSRAAVNMFGRSLVDAYYLVKSKATVIKIDGSGRSVTLTYPLPYKRGATEMQGATETLSRADVHQFGKAVAIEHGVLDAPTKDKKAKGEVVTTGAQDAILSNASTFADTVAALPDDVRDDITMTDQFTKMLASSLRARFIGEDKVIMTRDVIEFMRKYIQNATIDSTEPPRKINQKMIEHKSDEHKAA